MYYCIGFIFYIFTYYFIIMTEDFDLNYYIYNKHNTTLQTRSGEIVRIICTDKKGNKPIVALINDTDNVPHETVVCYPSNGKYDGTKNHPLDLCMTRPLSIMATNYYLCTRTVVMHPTSEIAYRKGRVYLSEIAGCITDEQGIRNHSWGTDGGNNFRLAKLEEIEPNKADFLYMHQHVTWNEMPLDVRKHDYPYYFDKDGNDCFPIIQ